MAWFHRKDKGILTRQKGQQEIPDGYWIKCRGCTQVYNHHEFKNTLWVCGKCNFHMRLGAEDYFNLLLNEGSAELQDRDVRSTDPLGFKDRKSYADRLQAAAAKTKLSDAVLSAVGFIEDHKVSIACMDFRFIGGSMGSVVGELIARAIRRATDLEIPLIVIAQSGGARMMEGALSLMQMAKTSANLTRLHAKKLPYIAVLTNPTTGGVTASFAMLGDIAIAEPGALIGFAGPRVIRETIGQDLPPGFQSSEFLKEHGFVDLIVDRRHLRSTLAGLLRLLAE
ncbi:MAG: acetyl-CoA carboxylase, carboxyltransferase subunit beta [Bacteroidota bacterium]|nr:acetyl-CoA carboxylase, carboxyltransferase subunit beta [Bacteroidota bacterium]MDE2834333.1 acetyl-CoA carboxylase, carboxyltransferase subunit beta [Bacteroidota bacterium]MDE2957146.1 acetyl-CoA carboxylase, carboxyltransferase subunit beta [Bacteroidota bacterium]